MLCAFKPPQNAPGRCFSTSSWGCWLGFAQLYLVGRSGEALSTVHSLADPSQWSNTAKKPKKEMAQWSRSGKSTYGLFNSVYFNFLCNCCSADQPSDGSFPSAGFPKQVGLKKELWWHRDLLLPPQGSSRPTWNLGILHRLRKWSIYSKCSSWRSQENQTWTQNKPPKLRLGKLQGNPKGIWNLGSAEGSAQRDPKAALPESDCRHPNTELHRSCWSDPGGVYWLKKS